MYQDAQSSSSQTILELRSKISSLEAQLQQSSVNLVKTKSTNFQGTSYTQPNPVPIQAYQNPGVIKSSNIAHIGHTHNTSQVFCAGQCGPQYNACNVSCSESCPGQCLNNSVCGGQCESLVHDLSTSNAQYMEE